MSVVAARALADEMCHDHDIPLLLLHDFDKAGFSMPEPLSARTPGAMSFKTKSERSMLGLSLDDVTAMRLEAEYQHIPRATKDALINNLRENGATEAEIAIHVS